MPRPVDVIISAIVGVIVSPVAAVVALVVRLRFGSPVLFRQERAGLGGAPFTMVKFRTMTDGRSETGQLLPDADRLTPLGRSLRVSSLDEIPELWNVLNGDMALVGPRPLPTAYLERYTAEEGRRHEVRPGITGWAQVNGRNATTWEERLAHDVWYVDNRSLSLDLRILGRTVRAVLRPQGIAAEGHATMPELRADGPQGGADRVGG